MMAILTRKRLIIGGAGVVAAVALTLGLRPDPLPVDVAPVTRGRLLVTIDEEGRTRVRDRYVVASPVNGRVDRIALYEGDEVQSRAVLAVVYATPLDPRAREQAVARLEAAQDARRAADAAAAQARAAWQQACRTSDRAESLATRGLIAAEAQERAALERALSLRERQAAEFRARAAAHDVAGARAALRPPEDARPILLRSPIGGRILRIPERSERVVSAGTPLLEVGDPTGLEAVAELLSVDAVRVRPGDRVIVERGGGDGSLTARVRTIEPSAFTKVSALGVEEQRVRVIADFEESPAPLGDGFRVELRVIVWEADDVLTVPVSALFRQQHDTGWAAFVIEHGRARQRAVSVGHRSLSEAEVLAGLLEGEVVVRHPADRVGDGVRVVPR